MPSAHETASALHGLKRLLRRDPRAVEFFGNTPEAFWNSFWVAVWAFPVYAMQSLLSYQRTDGEVWALGFFIVELLTYVIGWVLFPLVMIRVCDWLDRWPNYLRYITMYNWFGLAMAMALLPAVVFGGLNLLPAGLVALYFLAITAGFLVYGWWIAVHALKITGATAVGIVLLDSLLSLIFMRLTELAIGI